MFRASHATVALTVAIRGGERPHSFSGEMQHRSGCTRSDERLGSTHDGPPKCQAGQVRLKDQITNASAYARSRGGRVAPTLPPVA